MEATRAEAVMAGATDVVPLSRDELRVLRLASCCARSGPVARAWAFRYGVSVAVHSSCSSCVWRIVKLRFVIVLTVVICRHCWTTLLMVTKLPRVWPAIS
jgi:hypothetical protein